MARKRRADYPGAVHHVGTRGVDRTVVFRDDQDRRVFLAFMEAAGREHEVDTLLFCLLDDHVHLVVRSRTGRLSAFMQSLKSNFAQYFNERHGRDGHLFQGRFWSRVIEDEGYLDSVVRYVVWNPVEAGVCERPSDWPWSNHPQLERAGGALVELVGGPRAYAQLVALGPPARERRRMLKQLLRGKARDHAIRDAVGAGYEINEVAAGLGISRVTVWRALRRET